MRTRGGWRLRPMAGVVPHNTGGGASRPPPPLNWSLVHVCSVGQVDVTPGLPLPCVPEPAAAGGASQVGASSTLVPGPRLVAAVAELLASVDTSHMCAVLCGVTHTCAVAASPLPLLTRETDAPCCCLPTRPCDTQSHAAQPVSEALPAGGSALLCAVQKQLPDAFSVAGVPFPGTLPLSALVCPVR